MRVSASNAPSGSSSTSRRGRLTSARASATRCFWPPERTEGHSRARSARPTRRAPSARLASAEARRSRPDRPRLRQHGRPGQQARLLEHHADIVAGAAPAPRTDAAGVARFEPGEQSQQRALAAAAAPDDGDELPGGVRDRCRAARVVAEGLGKARSAAPARRTSRSRRIRGAVRDIRALHGFGVRREKTNSFVHEHSLLFW